MRVEFVNPFIVATQAVFKSMLRVPILLGKPYLMDRARPFGRISATISLEGGVSGLIVLAMSEPVALMLASGLSGTPMVAIDAGCRDALGELVNMIAGNAKKDLPGGRTKLGLPKLQEVREVEYPVGCPILAIPVDTTAGRFMIEAALRECPGAVVEGAAPPEPTPPTPDVAQADAKASVKARDEAAPEPSDSASGGDATSECQDRAASTLPSAVDPKVGAATKIKAAAA